VMAISVIAVSSDSSEDSVGTPIGRVILFGTIPTIILDTTPTASLDYSPASDTESDLSEDPSSDHIPSLPAISPFYHRPMTPQTMIHLIHHHYLPMKLVVGHSVDHSSSDYFSPDDSARDSSSDSLSEASSDFHSDASSDSLSRHSLSDHSSLDLSSTSAGISRKRRRSPMTSVPALPPVSRALSSICADLIPSLKRVRDSGYLADVEVNPRETSLRDDVIVRGRDEPHLEQDIDPEIQAEIDKCIVCVDALRDRGIDARVELRLLIERRVRRVRGARLRIVGVESAVTALTERIAELERDNRRLRGTVSVKSQRVDQLQRGMSRMQRELRQMR
ncbi:hypothetical protein Tco_1510784, partial [Tanacetum coccineum]